MPRTYACLWFDRQAEEAVEFYVSAFPRSTITATTRYPEGSGERAGEVLTVAFELDGTPYVALNGGPEFTFDEAISLTVDCKDQEEIDYYWDALTSGGGEEGPCGWLKDRFGLSWQVVPRTRQRIASGPSEQGGQGLRGDDADEEDSTSPRSRRPDRPDQGAVSRLTCTDING